MDRLLLALIKLVSELPGLTGREYARILRNRDFSYVTKGDVNQRLYGYPTFFIANADDNFRPAWETTKAALTYYGEKHRNTGLVLQPTEKPKTTESTKSKISEVERPISPQASLEKLQCELVWDGRLSLYEWQKNALEFWKSQQYHAIIQAVTGSGKTRLAVAAIDAFLQCGLKKNQHWKVLIIVPTIDLMNQWNRNINKDLILPLNRDYRIGFLGDGHKRSFKTVDIIIGTSSSVLKYKTLPKTETGLIIGDEVHHYGTVNSPRMLEKGYICRLGLTAHLERIADKGVEEVIIPYFGSNDFYYSYADAIEDEVIASFEILFIIVEMTDNEKIEMSDIDAKITKANRQLIGKYPDLKNAGTDQFWSQLSKLSSFDTTARIFKTLIYQRRNIVVNLESKLKVFDIMGDLVKHSKGTFGFTQTSETADRIVSIIKGKNIKINKLDRNTLRSIRPQVIKSFENREIDMLVAPILLDEGIDVKKADLAIITGRNTSIRQTIQRIGRVIRKKEENGMGHIVIIASKDTIEDPNNPNNEAFYEAFSDADITIHKCEYPKEEKKIKEIFEKWKN